MRSTLSLPPEKHTILNPVPSWLDTKLCHPHHILQPYQTSTIEIPDVASVYCYIDRRSHASTY